MSAFHDAFLAIPFDKPEASALTVGAFANIGSRRLRTEESFYQAIRLAGPVNGCSVTAWVCNSLAGSLEVVGKLPALRDREARRHTHTCFFVCVFFM